MFGAVLAAALACVLSCGKPGDLEPVSREPIRFSCSPVSVTSRAGASYVGDDALTEDQHFAVYAWDTGSGFLPADPVAAHGAPAFLNNLDVHYRDNADKGKNNTYSGDLFWPTSSVPAYDYSFFAYYPYAAGSGITGPTFSAGNIGQYGFTAKGDVAQMVDFCVSDVSNDVVYGRPYTYSAYDGTVGLTFRHTLTRVQIKFVKAQDVDEVTHIYIEDAKLVNIRKNGTLTVSYAQYIDAVTDPENPAVAPGYGRKGTTSFLWATDPDIKGDYEISLYHTDPDPVAVPPVEVDLGYSQTVYPDEVFLMVPQTILKEGEPLGSPSPQGISFRWRVDDAPATDDLVLFDESVSAIGSSMSAGITEWTANMSVVYTVVIKAKPIEFALTASIVPWDDDSGYYPLIP